MLALEQSYYRKQVIVSDIDNEEFWDFILDPKQLSGKPRLQVKVIDVLFKNGQLNKSIQVLNQLEEEVLYFGDVELVRALVYQKQMNSESDVEHFKKMLLDYQKKDLYHPLVIHWLIRVAALEDNVKGVLEQVMYRLQYQLMTNNLINITDVGNIRIIVNGEVDGIYLDVKNGKASLIIGQVTLDKIIQNLKKVNDDSQSDQLLVEYSRKISVRFESGVFSQYEQKKVKGLFQNMIVDLAVWSEVPSVD